MILKFHWVQIRYLQIQIGDGFNDSEDTFPVDQNENTDTDDDGIGNNADQDDDNDGLSDEEEIRNGTSPINEDTDGDGVNDNQDDLPLDQNETIDTDGDGIGNNTDPDDDNDGLTDLVEEKQLGQIH